MNFNMKDAIEVLERTPQTLTYFLTGLSDGWLHCNEGEETWNAIEVVEHLIEGEKNNWIQRLELIISDDSHKTFPPYDRFAHLNNNTEVALEQKLQEFNTLRSQNISKLKSLIDPEKHLELSGTHPVFGSVKLREVISTWVAHDLTHIAQIVRVMAKRYTKDVGPWIEYLSILKKREPK
ncbi:DinB family protein [Cytobacillus solani]|uniref:DinB family protein n=1 Tax=Cytobacillus solani TaxID=1637975 RepID=UPI001152DCBB|nr:DinB family protein [Cytobacillus solani]USK53088.1 DinB family protein [Cytobacillus solani]